jgi:RHS repeat-associated protein
MAYHLVVAYQATDRLGQLRTYQFDANGNAVGQSLTVSINGSSTQVDSSSTRYDDSDRAIQSQDAGGFATAFTYDAAGNVLTVTNPDGYVVSYDYDAANRPIHAYDQEGNAVTTKRDTSGRTRTVTDPNGNTTTSAYWDATRDGRLKSVTYPRITNNGSGAALTSGRSVQYDYDAVGNVKTVTEVPAAGSGQANRVTTTSYDELNRPVRIVGPQYTDNTKGAICPVTVNTYDTLGRVTQVAAGYTPSPCTTASSDVTTMQQSSAFDDFDRKITSKDGLNRAWAYVYDANNNVLTVTDPKTQTTSYTWGTGHQLLTRTEQGGRTTTYTRNALGQVLTVTHPNVNYTYGYDAAHRLIWVSDGRADKTLSYDWSPGGLLNGVTDSDGRQTTYLYDPVGRLAGITAPNGDTLAYQFDAGGRLVQRTMPNGLSAHFAYNEDNSLRQVIDKDTASHTLSQHDYAYDGVGMRAKQAENIGGTTLNYAYTYDELKRLTQVANGTATQQENYTWDAVNNRLTKSVGQTSPAVLAYKYDAANQLIEIHTGSASGPLQAALAHDANGNITSDGTRSYTWDALDQLSQVSSGSTIVAYSYDDSGKRIKKVTGGTTTQWTYDGQDIYAEYPGTWTTPNAVYTNGGATDDPVVRAAATGAGTYGTASYYHADGLGSIVGTSNNADATTQTERFDAWGNKLSGTVSQSAQYGFTGREPDETGLVYMRARYYSPGLGRFVSRDPIGMKGGLNPYVYCENSPTNCSDPSGLLPQSPLANFNSSSYYGAGTQVAGLSLTLPSLPSYDAVVSGATRLVSPIVDALPVIPPSVSTAIGLITSPPAIVGAILTGFPTNLGQPVQDQIYGPNADPKYAPIYNQNSGNVPSNVGPGPNAGSSVPAGPGATPTREQQGQINDIGNSTGCHTCGATDPGTKSGDWVGDHQPPTKLNPPGNPQRYYPQCKDCSNQQGGRVRWLPRP